MKGLALSLASILIFLGIAEAEALLQRFAVVAARLGAKPVVLFLPGKGETAEDKERREYLIAVPGSNLAPGAGIRGLESGS